MKKYFFIFFLITLILLLVGCGGECKDNAECDDSNDCTTDKCVKRECVFKKIPDCTCGNGECEEGKGENECICSKDCGRCSGKVGDYLEKSCTEDDECVVDVIEQKPVVDSDTIEDQVSRKTQVKMIATYSFDEPFNLDKSLLNVKYELDTKIPEVRNLRIEKVQVMEVEGRKIRGEYKESRIIGEFSEARPLWDEFTDISVDIMLDSAAAEEGKGEEKKIVVKTIYSYDTIERGNPTTKTKSHLGSEMDIVLANPTKEQECPPVNEWDDGNECTTDSCSEATNYFVLNEVKQGACAGNYICEAGENKCTTPQDCGSCKGQVGDYIRIGCVDDKCMSEFINPDIIEQKKIVEELSLPSSSKEHIKFSVTKMYDEPFDMSTSAIILKLEVMQKEETTSNFKITRMQLLEDDSELGFVELSQSFNNIGETHDLSIAADFSLPELQAVKEVVVKVYYSYDGKDSSGNPETYVNEDFEIKMPEMTFVNAGAEI